MLFRSQVVGHFYVQADNAYVLAGSKVEISAAAVDTNYIPVDLEARHSAV